MRSAVVSPIILLILTVISLTACGVTTTVLDNTKWVLESYGEQGNLKAVLEGSQTTAEFDSTKGEISGSAGCNSYFASYETRGKELTVSQIAHTEMACLTPEGIMEQEQQYLTLLSNAEAFQVEDSQLMIFCSDDQVLIFSAENIPLVIY